MLLLKNNKNELNLADYTVIVPSICVGNAAQLGCDLLISSKQMKRIGTIFHPALIPVYGPSAYQHEPTEKVAACEVYESEKDKLIVIQFRTPLISRHSSAFHKKLSELLKKASRVVILSGSFGFEKRVIEASPYEYRASTSFKEMHGEELNTIPWKEFTGETIFGGGNALQLYKTLNEENIPVMLLFRYLLEGDNSFDASSMVRELNDLCSGFLRIHNPEGSEEFKLTVPISWKLLFGNDVGDLIF